MNLTDAELEKLERLDKARTKGKWELHAIGGKRAYGYSGVACLADDGSYQVRTRHNHRSSSYGLHVAVPDCGHSTEEGQDACHNMRFIAAAGNAMPALLAEIRESRRKLRRVEILRSAAASINCQIEPGCKNNPEQRCLRCVVVAGLEAK